jgi:hypothetical protein
MEEKFDIFDSLKKIKKPAVPEGFFEKFSDNLSSNIEDGSDIQGLNKSDKIAVPSGFFDNFSDQLMDKINEQEEQSLSKNKSGIFTLKRLGVVAAVAACVLLIFTVLPNNSDEELTVEVAIESTDDSEQVDEAYLAFLDEDEMIDFLIENDDIDLGDDDDYEDDLYSDDDLYYLLGEDIEEYYLEEL